MIPIVTPAEMGEIDASAKEPVEVLIERAGEAVARRALQMLGGTYGKRVVVVAGKGNNGADGRAAARRLRRRGVRVEIIDATSGAAAAPDADLLIDAAYGTGFRGEYAAPDPGRAAILAVDIPSGVNGDTGEAAEGAVRADATVTFAALKPGLLINDGPEHSGEVEVVDIGLDASQARAHLVEARDVRALVPGRPRTTNKWAAAVYVLAGSPGMYGAATLAARAALRAGAGTVRLGIPGADPATVPASEVVVRETPAIGFGPTVLEDADRCASMVIGPGLGLDDRHASEVRRVIADADKPMVLDADALSIVSENPDMSSRRAATVLTPHEGEFGRLAGDRPGLDRFADVRALAAKTGATLLLKGPTTIVADPDGQALVSMTGGPRLATAGSGDVLSGIIGAFLALRLPSLEAAGLAAYVHGAAAELGPEHGLVAGDLVELLPRWLSDG
jgi:ADP-dependent NAD(P)H-hydrate dehydratase / NAD(P)H-hydrate epimerase